MRRALPNKIERHFAFEVRLATPNRTFRTSAHIGGFKRICYAEALCLNHHVCFLREKRRGRDSNSRALSAFRFSRPAQSTALPPLPEKVRSPGLCPRSSFEQERLVGSSIPLLDINTCRRI